MSILANGLVIGLTKYKVSKEPCEICVKGKQSRQPFIKGIKHASKLLELIHSDICWPMSHESIGSARYFIRRFQSTNVCIFFEI